MGRTPWTQNRTLVAATTTLLGVDLDRVASLLNSNSDRVLMYSSLLLILYGQLQLARDDIQFW